MLARFVVLVLVFLSSCARRSTALRDVDATIEKDLANAIPSIAVAVARNGSVVHEAAFGFADAEANRRATVHTPYPLASVTKPFVATRGHQLSGTMIAYASPEGLRHLYPFPVRLRRVS